MRSDVGAEKSQKNWLIDWLDYCGMQKAPQGQIIVLDNTAGYIIVLSPTSAGGIYVRLLGSIASYLGNTFGPNSSGPVAPTPRCLSPQTLPQSVYSLLLLLRLILRLLILVRANTGRK